MTAATLDIATSACGRVLVVDDHARARESISDVLRHAGHQVNGCASAVEAIQRLDGDRYDLIVTDLQMPGMSGIDFIRHIEQRRLQVQVVMITAHASVATAVEAMRHGAFDYIEKPFDVDQLESLVARAIQHGRLLDRRDAEASAGAPPMIGDSPAMRALRECIAQVAPTDETVLITGESGTGKELVAQSIHAASRRAGCPLVSLNCPVLSEQLTESELFGHERGAFTGAETDRTGRFELADGGTLLLDEVTEIDLRLQAKLLRVLQERAFERVGSSKTIHVDVRVLATTNRDLEEEVRAGQFREDLFYRLAVVPLRVPPLRQRAEDIPALADHFLSRAAARLGRQPLTLDRHAADLIVAYDWPGNVRELQNVMTRACVLCGKDEVSKEDLRPYLLAADNASDAAESADLPVGMSLEQMERKLIEATLAHFDGHRAKTAEALGIGLRTLSGKLKSYGYRPREKSFGRAA